MSQALSTHSASTLIELSFRYRDARSTPANLKSLIPDLSSPDETIACEALTILMGTSLDTLEQDKLFKAVIDSGNKALIIKLSKIVAFCVISEFSTSPKWKLAGNYANARSILADLINSSVPQAAVIALNTARDYPDFE